MDNNNNNNIAANMQQLQENQDGTLTGGFLSVSNGRPRIIIGGADSGQPTFHFDHTTNCFCYNNVPGGCRNTICGADNHGPCGNSVCFGN